MTGTHRLALALSLGLAACNPMGPVECTANFRRSVIVEVRDAATGAPAAAGATGYVQDGDFREALNATSGPSTDPLRMYGPLEQPGRFTVVVEKEGYRRWVREDVRVARDPCHVNTAELRAELQPLP